MLVLATLDGTAEQSARRLASNTNPRPFGPLSQIEHPSALILEILPRIPQPRRLIPDKDPALRQSDSIRLTLSAFSRLFYLHLHPNYEILHPDAQVNYFHLEPDGTSVLHHSGLLITDAVMAFQGEVVRNDQTLQRLREDIAGGLNRGFNIPSGSLGWARIIIHHQGDIQRGIKPSFEGSFGVDGVIYHIVTLENYVRNKHIRDPDPDLDNADGSLVVFRDSDVMTVAEESAGTDFQGITPSTSQMCTHDRLEYNRDALRHPVLRTGAGLDSTRTRTGWYDPLWLSKSPFVDMHLGMSMKRSDVTGNISSNFINEIGNDDGCSKSQKILYMGIAADCAYVTHYGGVSNATTQILNNLNIASAVYKSTFNISLGIIELNIQGPTCPANADPQNAWNVGCEKNMTLDDRLSLFSKWRGDKGDGDGAGLWHLMTGCPAGMEIGVAWLGTLCQTQASASGSSFVSGTAITTATRTEWGVLAHEIGHNLGAIHDCSSNCTLSDLCCPNSGTSCNAQANFLMSPVSEVQQKAFSPCTLGNVCTSMLSMNTSCLLDASLSRSIISLQMCGNGIVEPGEECDPGFGRNSTCCDSPTCKLAAKAVCDPENSDCCTLDCQFAPNTQVCRPTVDAACDQSVTCTGTNSSCPVHHTRPNGAPCGPGLVCATGVCTSLDQQCRTIGVSMNFTTACNSDNDKTCLVSCRDPNNPNACLVLQMPWIDGSPCGYGGSRENGSCIPGSLIAMAKAIFANNAALGIPISVGVGLVFFFALWASFLGLVRWCCCGRRHDGRMKPPASAPRVGSFDAVDPVDIVDVTQAKPACSTRIP